MEEEKRIPTSLAECRRMDAVSSQLWNWAKSLRRWGEVLLAVIFLLGVLFAVVNGAKTNSETDGDLATVLIAMFTTLLTWGFYAVIEFLIYQTLALLISALASIVQHTKLTADLELYKIAQAEGYVEDKTVSVAESKERVRKEMAPVDLTVDNIEQYVEFTLHCDHTGDKVNKKGDIERFADVYVTATPKNGGRFGNVLLELAVQFGEGYKSLDDVSEDYVYDKGVYTMSLSADGVGQTVKQDVRALLKNGQSPSTDKAVVKCLSVKGQCRKGNSADHRWRCECGHMIGETPCPYCGAK